MVEYEFDNSLLAKRFGFEFVNTFFSLYLHAFFKPYADMGSAASYNNVTYGVAQAPNNMGSWFGTCSCKAFAPKTATRITCAKIPAAAICLSSFVIAAITIATAMWQR